ncbi:hypothetical protein FA13DRAFT_1789631 [Coprinellus micaceus]|uniref:Uncharacterized protein n=1 Tax=Coprinellus micaceus TaxID=71717 RepID=A0A4Y7TIK5_COPMI|nr:hypothetical protein FA13DRAFT_1789631 [Coprinellus micaceus]
MSTASTLTYEEVKAILSQWKASGTTPEQQDQFFDDATRDLQDPEKDKEYQANVEQVGVWANEVDAAFGRVMRSMEDMVQRYGSQFPELAGFRDDWNGYNARWVSHLALSRDVASEDVTILRRFDQIFLAMVENIVTDQDREDAIIELQSFIDEDHSDSDRMAKGFYALQADIQKFLDRFNKYVEDKGEELKQRAKELQVTINGLQSTISDLNWEIAAAIIALIGAALGATTILGLLLGVVAAEATLMLLVARRLDAELKLQQAQRDLAEVNATQKVLAYIKTEFVGLKPDINLICEKLGLFGDIWQGIRSDSIRFQTQLKKGLEPVSDARFKREIRLERAMCKPMQAGLEMYASVLENRPSRESKA